MHYGFVTSIIEASLTNGTVHLILKTREPIISSHPDIQETVLSKGQAEVRLVPLTFETLQFTGPEIAVTDPKNKQRLIVIS